MAADPREVVAVAEKVVATAPVKRAVAAAAKAAEVAVVVALEKTQSV